MSAVEKVTDAVAALGEQLDDLVAASTDPQATDLAAVVETVREARKALTAHERHLEHECARAMLGDYAEGNGVRVERSRGAERKAWDHDSWRHDVRAKVLRAHGLAGAQGVVTADGELVDPTVVHELLAAVQNVHSAGAPKSTAMKALGLDVRDYCESSPGAWQVRVTRLADDQDGGPCS